MGCVEEAVVLPLPAVCAGSVRSALCAPGVEGMRPGVGGGWPLEVGGVGGSLGGLCEQVTRASAAPWNQACGRRVGGVPAAASRVASCQRPAGPCA